MISPYIYALLSALFESLKDVSSKLGLKDMDEYLVSWAFGFFALPFLVLPFIFISIPLLGSQYWIALLADGTLNVIATIFQLNAIKHSDLSLTIPLLAFTPLFLLIMSPIILGQFPTPLGVFGVIMIVIGSYVLNIQRKGAGYLAPFKAMVEHHGPKMMLIAAFILSITSSIDKIGVLNSSPLFWAVSVHSFTSISLAPLIIREFSNHIKLTNTDIRLLFAVGFFSALSIVTQYMAITTLLVPYVIAIKRTSTIMSVLFGSLIFKEKGIKGRLLGAGIMVLGVILITLS